MHGVTLFMFLDEIIKIEDAVKEVIFDVDDQLHNNTNSTAVY